MAPKFQHADGTVYTVSGDEEIARFEASEQFTEVGPEAVSPSPPVIEYGDKQGDQPIAVEVTTEPLQTLPEDVVHTPEPVLEPGDRTPAEDVANLVDANPDVTGVPDKAEQPASENTEADATPDETWRNADIEAYLDRNGKSYTKGSTKADLLSAAKA